jgi:hypothetical protein
MASALITLAHCDAVRTGASTPQQSQVALQCKNEVDCLLSGRISDVGRGVTLRTGATMTRVGQLPKEEAAGVLDVLLGKCAGGWADGWFQGAAEGVHGTQDGDKRA